MLYNGEIFYLVGKPGHLKNKLVSELKASLSDNSNIIVPETISTKIDDHKKYSYSYVEEKDFDLRQSMGLYCLSWKKSDHKYAISAEVIQRLGNGKCVVINGSMYNVDQAAKMFPKLNVVMVQYTKKYRSISIGETKYPLVESESVSLDWVDRANGVSFPYLLSIEEDASIKEAASVLTMLFDHNEDCAQAI